MYYTIYTCDTILAVMMNYRILYSNIMKSLYLENEIDNFLVYIVLVCGGFLFVWSQSAAIIESIMKYSHTLYDIPYIDIEITYSIFSYIYNIIKIPEARN